MKISPALKPLVGVLVVGFTMATSTITCARTAIAVEWPEATKQAFINSCKSGFEKKSNFPPDIAQAYCQCTVDGLSSENVSAEDFQTFISNAPTPEKWPESVKKIIFNCAATHLMNHN